MYKSADRLLLKPETIRGRLRGFVTSVQSKGFCVRRQRPLFLFCLWLMLPYIAMEKRRVGALGLFSTDLPAWGKLSSLQLPSQPHRWPPAF